MPTYPRKYSLSDEAWQYLIGSAQKAGYIRSLTYDNGIYKGLPKGLSSYIHSLFISNPDYTYWTDNRDEYISSLDESQINNDKLPIWYEVGEVDRIRRKICMEDYIIDRIYEIGVHFGIIPANSIGMPDWRYSISGMVLEIIGLQRLKNKIDVPQHQFKSKPIHHYKHGDTEYYSY